MSNNISSAFEIDGVYGGEKPSMQWPLIGLVLLVAILLFYYFTAEGVCGGKDQLCPCDGNETMAEGPMKLPPQAPMPSKGMIFPRKSAEDALSKVSQGL